VRQREIAKARQAEAHRRGEAERDRLHERMRTQRAWSEQGVRGERRRPRDNDRAARGARIERTEKQAAKVRATERALERLERVEKPWEGWELRMSFGDAPAGSEVVARLSGAVVERGAFRLGPLDLEVRRGERVAILGPNGSGKTTLIGALLGRMPLRAGSRHLGPAVVVGELDQARALLPGASALDAAVEATGLTPQDARSLLAKFGLGAEHVLRPADRLSPGERTRAELAVLTARGVNLLVLDEPTNHLDLEAIEQLETALERYAGTLLLVTHDRRLLERVRLTRRIALPAP
jgi:ATPase subunit of ABC transporter with duplicated ATPase domains